MGGTDFSMVHVDVSGRSNQTLTLASGQTLAGSGAVNGALIVSPGLNRFPGRNQHNNWDYYRIKSRRSLTKGKTTQSSGRP